MLGTQMPIAQQQQMAGGLSDQQLASELQKPSGMVPSYILMAEIRKRQGMRSMAQAGTPANSTVKDDILKSMFGNSPMTPNIGVPMPSKAPPVPAPTYADGGAVDDEDGDVDPSLMPSVPQGIAAIPGIAGSGPRGLYLPSDITNSVQASLPGLRQAIGLPATPIGYNDYLSQSQSALGDPSQAYAAPLAALQAEIAKQKSQGTGNALLRMGMAMMNSHGGNIFNALGAGGGAALDSLDKSDTEGRTLQGQLMNAQIGQANSKMSAVQAAMNAANARYGHDATMSDSALRYATTAADTGARSADTAATLDSGDQRSQNNIDAENQRSQAQLLSAQTIAKMQEGAAYAREAMVQQHEDSRAITNHKDAQDQRLDAKDDQAINSLTSSIMAGMKNSPAAMTNKVYQQNPQQMGIDAYNAATQQFYAMHPDRAPPGFKAQPVSAPSTGKHFKYDMNSGSLIPGASSGG